MPSQKKSLQDKSNWKSPIRMKTFYSRIGSKYLMALDIIKHIPYHTTYVEPFFGSGGVFFAKRPSTIEIINDLDSELIDDYKAMLNAPKVNEENYSIDYFDDILKNVKKDKNAHNDCILKLQRFLDMKTDKIDDSLVRRLLMRNGGFSSRPVNKNTKKISRPINPLLRIQRVDEYRNRMKDTKICCKDYKELIDEYDSEDTLFYLDPPYEESDKLYNKNSYVNLEEMRDILSNIKGKFMLSINGSDNTMKIFKDFNIVELELKTNARPQNPIGGKKKRIELLVKNF